MSGRLGEAQAGIKIAGRLIYTSVSLLLSRTQGYCYHLSKFHIYALVYCIYIYISVQFSCSVCLTAPLNRWFLISPPLPGSPSFLKYYSMEFGQLITLQSPLSFQVKGSVCLCVCVCVYACTHSFVSNSLQSHGL